MRTSAIPAQSSRRNEPRERATNLRPSISSSLPPQVSASATPSFSPPRFSTTQCLRFTSAFARQLHILVSTGIPLAQSLHAAERQATHAGWKSVLSRLANAVDEGTPLSIAMSDCGVFSAVAVSLIQAGETSGDMAAMLERLAELKRKQLKLRTTLTAALLYPALLTTMGIGVFFTMLLFVLPRFKILFSSLDSPLPTTTQMLMNLSEFIRNYWFGLLPGVGLLAVGAYFGLTSSQGRQFFDCHYLSLPGIGPLGRSILSARVARMIGTLLESKVQLTDALELTRRGAGNQTYADLVAKAEDAVSRGQPLSSVTDATDLLVPSVQEAIRSGEQSGRLGQPLVQLAEFLDEENDATLKNLTRILEPLILIALGLVVGFVAVSIFLPMFDMITAAQGGGGGPSARGAP